MSGSVKGVRAISEFDDRNINWYSPDIFEGVGIYICDVDVERKTYDFLFRIPPNQIIAAHRHMLDTKTFVIKGEHRIYELDGSLREIRHAGTYTSTPAGAPPHREGAGEEGGIVFFSVRGDGDLFELMDENADVIGVLSAEAFAQLQLAQDSAT